MKGKMKPVIGCTVSALALSMFTSVGVFAYPSTIVGAGVGMQKSGTEQQESTDTTSTGAAVTEDKWTYRSVADVDTAINIRSNTSTESRIVGVLPKAGVADVIDRGEEWTYIKSGDIEGYVKTDYLAFGDDARELAEVYGEQGVEASWNDVNIFESADPAAKIVKTVDEGEELQVLNREGHWYFVQLNADTMAYVPAEDVEETLLLDKAVPYSTGSSEAGSQGVSGSAYAPADTNGPTDSNAGEGQTEGSGLTDGTSTEQSSQTEAPQTDYTEQTEAPYTEAPQTEYTEQTEAPYTEAPQTEAPQTDYTEQTEAPYTEAPQTEAPQTDYTEQTEAPYTEAPQTEAPQTDYVEETEAPYTEAPQTEAPETEAPQTEGTEASGSDVDLLAAIIYCEAGNQSREGKVAVGAVVMHRVYSDSFPNNIHDVIYQSGQFTPAYSGSLASALANGVPSDCYEAAQAALSGEDPVPGMFYFNTAYGSVQIGAHWFS